MMNKCRILPLYGTLDLIKNDTLPICRREKMQMMMPTMRKMAEMKAMTGNTEDEDDLECPTACNEEEIVTDISFSIMTDEEFEKAWNMWTILPRNRTKFDAVFMELYFTSLTSQAKYFKKSCI